MQEKILQGRQHLTGQNDGKKRSVQLGRKACKEVAWNQERSEWLGNKRERMQKSRKKSETKYAGKVARNYPTNYAKGMEELFMKVCQM